MADAVCGKSAVISDSRDTQECQLTYVLITPARDEEAFRGETIKFVIKFREAERVRVRGLPVWEIFRSVYRMSKRPFVVGACFRLAAFIWGMVRGVGKVVPKELVEFRRKKQIQSLRQFFNGVLSPWGYKQIRKENS